jgi:hypothetical protein
LPFKKASLTKFGQSAVGNEPVQADNMYRKFAINRETGLLATVFASAGAAFFSWHSRLSLFGIVAFAAASLAVYGTGRRSILGWSGLVISVIVALVLHVLLRRSNIV